ncbi:SCO1/SenC-domain-containing protein [Xylaria bambusicola]|uniref:SCO1/SenC-domain-containing protein n=1 Tax=Xylaria bambusicola TaxID=326684 RepID=UPI00200779A4|nr:SCO1/SenC-domain-containing protein [Xylaria bambusicola]KAI0522172.1 SCO1/SenC-domain-containing protein [Xylaria bambusicola]
MQLIMKMSHSMAPSRSLLRTCSRAQSQTQTCQRLAFSTRHAFPSSTTTPTTADRPALITPTIQSARFTRLRNELPPSIAGGKQQRRYKAKTVEEARSRYRTGPFSWKAGVLFVLAGCGLVWYFESEKKRMQRRRIAEATKGVGKPKVGGDFNLIDHEGKPFSSANLKGRYSLVYFGFTHCPDICPEELDKMAQMFDLVEAQAPGAVAPVFITCDPARDDPKVLKSYLAEFHPKFIGLTGTYDEIKDVCKAYRVYFSTPKDVKPGQDYLVDHSIYFYLMDPEGDFVEALGRQHSPQQAASVILDHVKDWKK